MEVHHHPHTEKKGFKGYLLEFLMIFLAVTLGFFAESLREHLGVKKSVHEYMQQLAENLKTDTMICNHVLDFNKMETSLTDSFRSELDRSTSGKGDANKLYYYFAQMRGYGLVKFTKATIEELKSSGALRLIDDKKLSNDILKYYDLWVGESEYSEQWMTQSEQVCRKTFDMIFDQQYIDTLVTTDNYTFEGVGEDSTQQYIEAIKKEAHLLNCSALIQSP